MKTPDGFVVTTSILERMKQIFSILPREQKEKCSLCDETMTHVIKQIEAQANVSNRQACRFLAEQTGKKEGTIRDAVRRTQGKVAENPANEPTPPEVTRVKELVEEVGVSEREAARRVAEETGKKEETIRSAVKRSKAVFNKSDIEWCDWTWNPVTGCNHGCIYCYARGIAQRFPDNYPMGFKPHYREERLFAPDNQPVPINGKNKVFVCSMADLFGEWVPQECIDNIIAKCIDHQEWTYIFLTKNPARYAEISFPGNSWIGTTIDKNDDLHRIEMLNFGGDVVKFVSFEPLLEDIDIKTLEIVLESAPIDWVIIGLESGNRQNKHIPTLDYIFSFYKLFRERNIPIFIKNNTSQSFPVELP